METNMSRVNLIQAPSNQWLADSPLFTNATTRGFLSESGVVFNFVQRASRNQELLSHTELIKSSRKYRSVIHSWFLKVVEQLSEKNQAETDLEELAKVLTKLEIAWHLCEILYIDINSKGTLLAQLLQWIKWHFTRYVEIADQVISSEMPQMHEFYWDVTMFFALRGDMVNASLLLEIHSESKTDELFIVVRDLLKKYPVFTPNIALHEYYLRWESWHSSVVSTILDTSHLNTSQKKSTIQLNLLLNLLAGDLESLKSVSYLFNSWYEMMVSYLLFDEHAIKGSRLDLISDRFINIFYASTETPTMIDPFDELIRSAFNYDLMDVVKRGIECFNDNWWFVTHFVDLIYNSSQYNEYQIDDIDQIRASFIHDYADALLRQPRRFWQLSIEYRLHCSNSLEAIHTCLDRIPFHNQRELQKLLTYARRFSLVELEQSLSRIEARRWLVLARADKAKLGSALLWAIRSRDKMMINHIVDLYLRHYLRSAAQTAIQEEKITSEGELLDIDAVTNISPMSIVLSERLIFLFKYHEFHQLKKTKNYVQAGKILVDMLASNAVPGFFTLQVIFDCWPLLKAEEIVFDARQTYTIINSLELHMAKLKGNNNNNNNMLTESSSLVWNYDRDDLVKIDDDDSKQDEAIRKYYRQIMDKHENILRLAISRNLSRNFLVSSF